MKKQRRDRRRFLKDLAGSAALLSSLPAEAFANSTSESAQQASGGPKAATPRIKFAVIGINHSHINSQVERGACAAAASWCRSTRRKPICWRRSRSGSRRRSSRAARTRSSRTRAIQLVLSSGIPDERAPLGIRVMQHGKDYMADKPGITTLEQLAEVRRVQARDEAHLLDHVQRAVRESRDREGRRAGQGGRDRPRHPDGRPRAASHDARDAAAVVLRTPALRRHPLRHRLAPGRSVPVLHRLDAGRGRRRRRSATCTIRSTRSSRTSAT